MPTKTVTKEQFTKYINKAQREPVLWIEAALGEKPWEKQAEILEAVRDYRFISCRSGHGCGKTETAAMATLWFLYSFQPSMVLTTAPTFRQVEDVLWRRIRILHSAAKVHLGGDPLHTKLDLAEDWFALGLSTDNPDRFQGFHSENMLIIVDEAAGVDEDIFAAINGVMAGGKAKLLLIGNPTALAGTFHDSFTSELYKTIHISSEQAAEQGISGLVTKEWINERQIEWGKESPLYQVRVLGDFPSEADDTLISLNLIEHAVKRSLLAEGIRKIGVDPARFGSDKTIILERQGNKVIGIKATTKESLMTTAGRVALRIKKTKPQSVRIDEVGVGSGVVDRLNEQGYKVEGVNVGEAANDPELFINKRAEYYWYLRQIFTNGDIDIPDDPELVSQLANIKLQYTSKGQIKLESKDDMKKRGLKSPDKADALMLAFAPVKSSGFIDYLKEQSDESKRQNTEVASFREALSRGEFKPIG